MIQSAAASVPTASRSDVLSRAEAQLRRLLHRSAAADQLDDIQTLLDCAELAQSVGRAGAARRLHEIAFLRAGFSGPQRRAQVELARRTGLWRADEVAGWRIEDAEPARFCVEVAIAELTAVRRLPALPTEVDVQADAATAARWWTGTNAEATAPGGDVLADLSELCRAMRSPEVPEELGELLERLRHRLADTPRIDLGASIGVDLDDLVGLYTAASFQHFLRAHHHIAHPPIGSAALFHAAGRFAPTALGAYFANVGAIVGSPQDLFGLIQAGGEGVPDPPALDRWSVLLATHLSGPLALDLVGMLGAMERDGALWNLFAVAVRRRDRPMVLEIRDAAIDYGLAGLAAAAQDIVASMASDPALELRILGEIQATFGDADAAERAFARALLLRPADGEIAERIRALRLGIFRKFAITHGFGERSRRRREDRQADSRRQRSSPPTA